jgi:hypothetical protein
MEHPVNKLAEALPKAWPAPDLPGYRNHPRRFATYSIFSYGDLPPLQEASDDQFRWLAGESPKEEWSLRADGGELEKKLREITGETGITLPRGFGTFLLSPELQARIRSCTACYLELPDHIVLTGGAEDGHLIHFLSDQQWCLHWYLHVNPDGEECVLCSPHAYGFDSEASGDLHESSSRPSPINLAEEEVFFCARSFGEFLYRFWIENETWFALTDGVPLTEMQRAYAGHYRSL